MRGEEDMNEIVKRILHECKRHTGRYPNSEQLTMINQCVDDIEYITDKMLMCIMREDKEQLEIIFEALENLTTKI